MNTLKYKVLFKNSLFVFLFALALYLLITLPTLVLPEMYIISAVYALSFGWIACLLFMALFALVVRINTSWHLRQLLVYLLVAVSVLAAFECLEIAGWWHDIWHAGLYLLFPASAVVAGWLSVRLMRRRIHACFVLFTSPARFPSHHENPNHHV